MARPASSIARSGVGSSAGSIASARSWVALAAVASLLRHCMRASRSSSPRETAGVGRLVELRRRGLEQRLGAIGVAGVREARGGDAQQLDVVDPRDGLGVRHAVPQLERALVERRRLAVGVHPLGGLACPHRPLERGGLVAGRRVVVSDGGRVVGAFVLLLDAGQREVQLGALAGQQVVRDHLAEQCVAHPVAALGVGLDEAGGDPVAQRVPQRRQLQLLERAMAQASGHGQVAQHLLRGRREPLDAQHQRLAQGGRERAAAVGAGGHQLLGVQGVALRAGEQALHEIALGQLADDVLELLGELVLGEGGELDAARRALELGQQGPQRVATVQFVLAVGRDDQYALGDQRGGEVGEEGARRAVSPVEVLDGQQQAALGAEPVDQREQGLEQARSGARGLVGGAAGDRLGGEPGEDVLESGKTVERRIALAGEGTEGGDDRRVGELALAEVDTFAREHADAVRPRGALELADEAGLADSGLAGDEGQGGPAVHRVAQGGAELGQLRRAAYEPCAGDPCRHMLMIAHGRVRRRRRRLKRTPDFGWRARSARCWSARSELRVKFMKHMLLLRHPPYIGQTVRLTP